MRRLISLVVLLTALAGFSVGAAAQRLRAGFIVQDYSGNMEKSDYKEFRYVTKLVYHAPGYDFLEGQDVAEAARVLDVQVIDRPQLLAAAESGNLDVVVLVRLYDFLEIVDGSRSSIDNTIVRTEAVGDLLVYRRDSGKVLVDKVNERELYELGNVKSPLETFKWRLSDLVNTMEGKELIR